MLSPIELWIESFRRFTARAEQRHPAWRRVASRDLAIDLGTTNTRVHVAGHGIVIDEPSVVALDVATDRVRAVGQDAKNMLGRTPHTIRTVCPLRGGVIGDFEVAEAMIRFFITRALGHLGILQPRVVMAVPASTTSVERRAFRHAAKLAGARDVYLIDDATAAALGAGLPVEAPHGHLVVDVGGGTTEVAVLALGGTVCGRSTRIGGDTLDDAIALHLRRKHNLLIGINTAEELKLSLGTAVAHGEPQKRRVRGRDLVRGVPHAVEVSSDEICEAIEEPLQAIARVVSEVLETTPPELASDVIASGMMLTGGGALLPGLDVLLAERTGIPAVVAEDPLHAAVRGGGLCLENLPLLRQLDREEGRFVRER